MKTNTEAKTEAEIKAALLAALHSAANRLETIIADYAGTQSDKDTLLTVRAAIDLAEGNEA